MNIFRELTQKPWLSPGTDLTDESPVEGDARRPVYITGLQVYFGVLTVMFSIIVTAYVLRLGSFGDAPATTDLGSLAWWSLARLCGIPPAQDWAPMPEPGLLWVNTVVLGLSSLAWERARRSLHLGEADRMRTWLLIGGGLGALFVVGQLIVWRQMGAGGYGLAGSPANAFFYLITAFHGLHMLGGLAVWGRTAATALSTENGAAIGKVGLSVDLSAVYAHFLLLIWILMFLLLLTT